MAGALLGGVGGMGEIAGRGRERDVREGLREIADLALAARVVFLGEQPDIVGEREQPLEQALRIGVAAEHDVVVDQPEAAGKERAFALG